MIDAHTHFYDPHRPRGTPASFPPKGDAALYRTVLPDEFRRVASPHGVTGTVVVEASTWVEDNQWVLDLAEDHPVIVGLVGNLSPGSEGFAADLRRFAANRLFRGIRLRTEGGGGEVSRGLNDKRFMRHLELLADHDLSLDLATWSGSLQEIARLAERVPRLRIVINHIAGVKVDGNPPPPQFLADLRAAAAHPNVFCKISGLVEYTGAKNGSVPRDPSFYRPTLDAFWEIFGEDRLIYGSNWPVCEHAAPYPVVFDIVNTYFTSKGPAARDKYFSRNALAAYKWIKRA